ncbi:hypothetical protein MPUL_41070 [Mycolicibacterium pulveris]|uniref:Uncharacterized protein n=1 Tax=Mycolicibacterium pulveris TaxID=36813 RepID=A0A7I7UQV8_MYCPV|nr:hypothetical protein MPUL_41070 [Mycolicibacterium pulveris]
MLMCNREATMPYAFWPVCSQHYNELDSGAEYRPQGSEQSATGMAAPVLLMGEALRDLNQYVVVEPPTRLTHSTEYPEGPLLPLRLRQLGGTEVDLTLILPDETIDRLAHIFRRLRPNQD